MSNFILSDLGGQSSTMRVGPNLGGFVKVDLHENFAIQHVLSVFYRNSKMEDGNDKDCIY